MKRFAQLFTELDQTTKTGEKVSALVRYFAEVHPDDQLWAVALLSHRRPKRTVSTALLAQWAAEQARIPIWLFEESYHVVGDLAETLALVLPSPTHSADQSLRDWIDFIRVLESLTIEEKKIRVQDAWMMLAGTERFLFNKLITGAFRVGVSQQLVVKALAHHFQLEPSYLAHRLMGHWSPDTTTLEQLVQTDDTHADRSKPYPFYLAYPLEQDPASLGDPADWQAERKWDGIRGQVIVRHRQLFVWSRGEELVTDKYPEYRVLIDLLPDGTVLDGEILPFKDGKPLGFQLLQQRIGRKNVTPKIRSEVPVVFMAYDVLEHEGVDWRARALWERRERLEKLCGIASSVLHLSPLVPFASWAVLAEERLRSRAFGSEGIMLKRKTSPYRDGRKRGDWWKWKMDPFTVDAVMIYAMRGHGRRANLYTDYTFAVWHHGQLLPFTKAYSGLTDEEIIEVDRWIKNHTIEKFGPVRSVQPELVFEIAFEGIQKSTRHKSGLALRFPRIHRWRKDKPAREADTLDTLMALLETQ
mgnify:CR=1 FL=1